MLNRQQRGHVVFVDGTKDHPIESTFDGNLEERPCLVIHHEILKIVQHKGTEGRYVCYSIFNFKSDSMG